MAMQSVTLNGGWTGFKGVNEDHAAANRATIDLINILDLVDIPIVGVRRDFTVAFFNKAATDVLGLSPRDIGRAFGDISVLAGLSRLEGECSRAIAGGVQSRVNFRDGDKWFVVRISPYTNDDRQVAGTVLTFTNVTAFRASIDQAIYERECTKAILNTVAGPLVVLSAEQQIQSGNRAFYTMFRLSREEAQGIPLYELWNGAFEIAPLRTQLKEMLAGGHAFQPLEVNHVIPGEDQRTLIVDARPLSFPGHSERRALVTFEDITARKQAEAANDLRLTTERKRSEEELRRSEAFLAEAQRLSLTGSFSWQVATDEITWSEQLYRIFEFDQGMPVTLELIGTRIHPEDIPLFNEMVERARSAASDFEYAHRLQMRDRAIKYLHLTAHGVQGKGGKLEYIGTVQDVTQRRLSEETLHAAQIALAHANRVTTMGQLTASIAHEVNQPIAATVMGAQVALRWLSTDRANLLEAREALAGVVKDGNRATAVINRIHDLIKRAPPKREGLQINEIIGEVIEVTRIEAMKNRVALRAELDDCLPLINGDRIQLQQVMLNLIINAVQAMSGLSDGPRELQISTRRMAPEAVIVEVRDSGPGLTPAALGRLFEAFYTTKSSGLGLGLSICRSIVQAHGGELEASANVPRGAVFRFTLPAAHAGKGTAS